MKVKICGITTIKDARMVVDLGADLLGLNFYSQSPRYVSPPDARAICRALRDSGHDTARPPLLVGVFVNASASEIAAVMDEVGLDLAQLSGDEAASTLAELRGAAFKAIRPADEQAALAAVDAFAPHSPGDAAAPAVLLDAYHPQLYGGTGEIASIAVARAVQARVPRMMLAGGLKPENVRERAGRIRPWGVDVASGVEDGQPGVKSPIRVRAFIEAVRGLEQSKQEEDLSG